MKLLIPITGILTTGTLIAIALFQGIDGLILSGGLALIGGLSGFTLGRKMK